MRPPPQGWDPFREIEDYRDRLARLFETFDVGGNWSPLVDLEELDDAYVFELELPGVSREDVDVEVDGNELRVSGQVRERERKGILRKQTRRAGHFEYRSTLPQEVDPEQIEASLADGVLTLRVPKHARSQPRRIEIRGA
jgi:HSP20 family protein